MSRRGEFETAARKSTARSIKSFRAAMRAGDCKRASVYLDIIEMSKVARNRTVHQLEDQFFLSCRRRG